MTHAEMLLKAKETKSPEELLALAKAYDIPMDEEGAAAYFAQLHKTGELADDELDSVSGGGCHHDGKLVVTVSYGCENWRCEKCGGISTSYSIEFGPRHKCEGSSSGKNCNCNHCKYCKYEDALWLCYHPAKRG